MTPSEIRQLLDGVRSGSVLVEDATLRLAGAGVADLGFATLDLHRKDRCGFPEVMFAEGKTAEWVEAAVRRLAAAGQDCFVTRVNAAQADHLAAHFPTAEQDRLARTLLAARARRAAGAGRAASAW